jgi:ubiquitin-protein ligase E3 B
MAHFRMHTQIRDQTSAFLRGFRTLVNPEWLSLFSTPEVPNLVLYLVLFILQRVFLLVD